MNDYHKTVLLQEAINALDIKPGKKYIDATLGGGGHTRAILDRSGIVLGIDTDEEALDFVKKNFQLPISNYQLQIQKGNFKDIDIIAQKQNFKEVSGILFDLGVSSHQLDTAGRGFSFQADAPLDMRMDHELRVKASDLVNILTKGELIELFTKLGEEHFARQIAQGIVKAREKAPVRTTTELSEIVRENTPNFKTKINPATKVFQALRIAVNDEFNNLREALPKAFKLLDIGGRLAVIAFHSLEDRIVKYQLKDWESQNMGRIITKKPIVPGPDEIRSNNRSRSAKLRVIEKI